MVSEMTIDSIVRPLRDRYAQEFGIIADWGYRVSQDEWGNNQVYIRITADDNLTADQITMIKKEVRDALRGNSTTKDHFPFVQFWAAGNENVAA